MDFKFKYTQSRVDEYRNITGYFVINNLLPGQGLTIGNALRRVLLSDIQGTAITGIRFSQNIHEFLIIPGIREDILEIMLNLKQISIKTNEKGPIFGKVNLNGPGVITGKSIMFSSSDVWIINTNQYIATISVNLPIEFIVMLEQSVGYQITNKFYHKNSNFLKIDTTFMPVINVNYKINSIYTKDNKILENLEIEITTNGSLTPEIALAEAAQKLILWFKIFI